MREAAGVALIALAAISLLAVTGATRGKYVTPVASVIAVWFGWGKYLLVAAAGLGGAGLLRPAGVSSYYGRLVAFELCALLTLGLLSAIGGDDLSRADAGLDGGRVGWGISTLLALPFGQTGGRLLLALAWSLTAAGALGLLHRLEEWLGQLGAEEARNEGVPFEPRDVPEPEREKPSSLPKPPKVPALPQSFRQIGPTSRGTGRTRAAVTRPRELPSLGLLGAEAVAKPDEGTIRQTAALITKTLAEFGIPASVVGYRIGPAVTQFAVQPGFMKKTGSDDDDVQMKVRVAQIAALEKDLTLALSAERLRIEAPVPGKPYVGLEVPNSRSSVVRLKSLLESPAFSSGHPPLTIALGRSVSGQPVTADLARMPHLLIAGATGSGKSVCITALAACLAMNNSPEELRMVMIDSKMVELLRFNGLPHLFGKVETKVDRIVGVLRWVVSEMEHRYKLLEASRARDLDGYNRKIAKRSEQQPALPRIVVLIDELADMMLAAPDQTERSIVRLAQMARATGIHLIVATQRPSTDVVTGLIKANFPARIAFAVASAIDSRVILDSTGAETLIGRGDLLFLNPEVGTPVRAQGVMVTESEIERIISHWQQSAETPVDSAAPWEKLLNEPIEADDDQLTQDAIAIVRKYQKASASLLQRRLRVGYPRAARLLDQLEAMGVVGPPLRGGKERDVLVQDETEDEVAA